MPVMIVIQGVILRLMRDFYFSSKSGADGGT